MSKKDSYEENRLQTIARVCHEANRAYCKAIGDSSQVEWDFAPDWQKESAIKGVAFHFANPDAGPEASHVSWFHEKKRNGWKYGPEKDVKKKEHPCMVGYDELPAEQRMKDYIFCSVIDSFRKFEEESGQGRGYDNLLVVEDDFRVNELTGGSMRFNCDIIPIGESPEKLYKNIMVMLSRGSELGDDMVNYYANKLKKSLTDDGKIMIL